MRVPVIGTIDERFLMHRLRSTAIGGQSGVVVAGALFFYHLAHHVIDWELFAVVATMALVKIAVLVWYRFND